MQISPFLLFWILTRGFCNEVITTTLKTDCVHQIESVPCASSAVAALRAGFWQPLLWVLNPPCKCQDPDKVLSVKLHTWYSKTVLSATLSVVEFIWHHALGITRVVCQCGWLEPWWGSHMAWVLDAQVYSPSHLVMGPWVDARHWLLGVMLLCYLYLCQFVFYGSWVNT